METHLTDRARQVLSLASAEAVKLHHPFVGTEHLLIGLVREGSGVAAKVLESLGLDLDTLEAQIEELIAPGTDEAPSPPLPMTPKATAAIEAAAAEAERMGQGYVGTEHLLLGLVSQEEGLANQVLQDNGIDDARVRQLIGDVLGVAGDSDPSDVDLPPEMPSLLDMIGDDNRDEFGAPLDAPPGDRLHSADRLALLGVSNIAQVRDLAEAAGTLLQQKNEAVANEDFERAAELRDALAALAQLAEAAMQQWQKRGEQ